jgi:hypothetical protein
MTTKLAAHKNIHVTSSQDTRFNKQVYYHIVGQGTEYANK